MENEQKTIKNVEYVKDTFQEYLSKKDRIAASDIKMFLASPKMYYYKKFIEEKKEEEEETHFTVGSALHEVILEPEYFKGNYIVSPKFDRRTREGKEAYNKFVEQSEGKKLLSQDDMTMIIEMAKNALENNTLTELIKDSYRELSCYTTDEKTGLLLRLRPDSLSNNKSTITDIKSCLDSSPKKFKKDVYNYGYSISAAYYMDFIGRENYVFCAIEKQGPYQISLYQLSDEMIAYGRSQYRMALDLIKWSRDNNYWCDYVEFEILKECYELGNLDQFLEIKDNSVKIKILQ